MRRDNGMKKTLIAPLGLLTVSGRTPARQFMGHVEGDHPKNNGDQNDRWDKKK